MKGVACRAQGAGGGSGDPQCRCAIRVRTAVPLQPGPDRAGTAWGPPHSGRRRY